MNIRSRIFLLNLAASAAGDQAAFKQHNISAIQALAMSDWLLDVDARVMDAIKYAKSRGFCSVGDAVIVVTGWVNFFFFRSFPLRFASLSFKRPGYGTTNTLRVIYAD